MNRPRQTYYNPPQVTLHTVICPERVICDSDSFFSSYDLTGEENSANNGYGSVDNGDY